MRDCRVKTVTLLLLRHLIQYTAPCYREMPLYALSYWHAAQMIVPSDTHSQQELRLLLTNIPRFLHYDSTASCYQEVSTRKCISTTL